MLCLFTPCCASSVHGALNATESFALCVLQVTLANKAGTGRMASPSHQRVLVQTCIRVDVYAYAHLHLYIHAHLHLCGTCTCWACVSAYALVRTYTHVRHVHASVHVLACVCARSRGLDLHMHICMSAQVHVVVHGYVTCDMSMPYMYAMCLRRSRCMHALRICSGAREAPE